MRPKLVAEEEEILQAHLHWSSYILYSFWALLGCLAMLATLYTPKSEQITGFSIQFVVFILPLMVRYLQNKCKTYAITNTRLYIEEGIFSKSKLDIPINTVDDIQIKQGLLQRMFNSGNIMIFSGNSIPTIIEDIDNPNQFKEQLLQGTNKQSQAA
jgi:uncharacterized membrane protein YdbT with pleckstrin-like domain